MDNIEIQSLEAHPYIDGQCQQLSCRQTEDKDDEEIEDKTQEFI